MHQVIERILLASVEQGMLQNMVRALAVLRRGSEADRELARFAAVFQPDDLCARIRMPEQMVCSFACTLRFYLGKPVLPVSARRGRLRRHERQQERKHCCECRQPFFHGIHLTLVYYLYCM